MRITYSERTLEWLAAAIYATGTGNRHELSIRYEELPERLRREFRQVAEQWLQAIVPTLSAGGPDAEKA